MYLNAPLNFWSPLIPPATNQIGGVTTECLINRSVFCTLRRGPQPLLELLLNTPYQQKKYRFKPKRMRIKNVNMPHVIEDDKRKMWSLKRLFSFMQAWSLKKRGKFMFKTQKDHWEVGKSNKQTGTSYEKPSFVFYLIHRVNSSLSDLNVMTPIYRMSFF